MIAVRAMEGDHRESWRRIPAGLSMGEKGRKGTELTGWAGLSVTERGKENAGERRRLVGLGASEGHWRVGPRSRGRGVRGLHPLAGGPRRVCE